MDSITDVFFKKLLKKSSESGKLRWNAIVEELLDIYDDMIVKSEQKYTRDELWNVLFEPTINAEQKLAKIVEVSKESNHSKFFYEVVNEGIEDPIVWDKRVSSFRY